MNKRIIFLLIILFIVSFVCFIVFDKSTQKANALIDVSQRVSGYAWSDNIGWIDFWSSVSNIWGETGHIGFFRDYAWSDNIGWIKLNPTLSFPGISKVNIRDDNGDGIGEVTGWIRACAGAENIDCSGNVNPNSGRWDGWIKMDGVFVDLETGKFSGFAWGSDVVGWISFNSEDSGSAYEYHVQKEIINNLPINLKANGYTSGTTINSGEQATISWALEPEDATKCYPSLGDLNWPSQIININNQLPSGTYTTPFLSSNTTYQLKCVGILGWGMESVNIGIVQPGFSLSLSTSTIKAIIFGKTLSANSSTTTITVNSTGGYTGQVQLSVSSGMPFGATEIFNPPINPISPYDYTKSSDIPVNGAADFSILNVPNGTSGIVTILGQDSENPNIESWVDIYFKAVNYDPEIIEK